jgi:hypothetical protein
MLNAAIHWPDMADPTLWPMAVHHAVWFRNPIPETTGITPIDIWTRSRWPQATAKTL